MSTPTDPYNSGNTNAFDDDDLLAPIVSESDDDSQPASGAHVSYGAGDELAWDDAFTVQLAESAAEAADPEELHESAALNDAPLAQPLPAQGDVSAEKSSTTPGLDEFTLEADDLTFPDSESHSFTDHDGASAGYDVNNNNARFGTRSSYGNDDFYGNQYNPDGGFNELPLSERENASLTDVVSAHSADEASYSPSTYNTNSLSRPVEEGESFASAYSSTGQLPAIEPDPFEGNTTPEPAGFAAPAAALAATREESTAKHHAQAETPQRAQFEEIPDKPKSRWGAHVGSIFATLILIPVAWYLMSDAGARLSLVENNPWTTGDQNWFAIVELIGSFVALLLLWLMARASSLGAQIWGFVLTIGGLTGIVAPSLIGHRVINELDEEIGSFNAFTGNVVHHLNLDLGSGRIAIYGFIVFLTGVMIHLARKSAGRRSETLTKRELLG